MTELDTTILNLLGKEVSFIATNGFHFFDNKGIVDSIVFSLSGRHQISIEGEEFYFFQDLLEFQILD
ncbi:MAG: hypothetical protein RSC45_13145 [Acinetobacter sp.]